MAGPWDDYSQSGSSGAEPWRQYSSEPEKPKASGIVDTVVEGAKNTGRAIASTVDAYTGNTQGVADRAAEQAQAPRDPRLEQFQADYADRTAALGEDPGLLPTIGQGIGAIVDNPAGAGLAVLEQLPNAAAVLGGGWAGLKGGAAIGAGIGSVVPGVGTAAGGTVGGVVGGLAGMFLGNAALETGNKAMAAADDGEVTQEELAQARREGAVKGGVITGVDALTLGVGGKVASTLQRTSSTALEAATRKTLMDRGVDVTSEAAVVAARANPEIAAAVRVAQDNARKATDRLGRRVATGGALLGMETVGEGVGEYLGELAATGEGNIPDAVLESLLSLGQSTAEASWNMARTRMVQPSPSAENPMPAPVPAPDPAAGVISRTAAQLPAPDRLALPAPEQVLYADANGQVSEQGPARNVDREQRPVPGREPGQPGGGPGMDQQTPRGELPITGEVIPAARMPQAQPPATQRTFDAEPVRQALPDLRPEAVVVDSAGQAQVGRVPNQPQAEPAPRVDGMTAQAVPGQRPKFDQVLQQAREAGEQADAETLAASSGATRAQAARAIKAVRDEQQAISTIYRSVPGANKALRSMPEPAAFEVVKSGNREWRIQRRQEVQGADSRPGPVDDRAAGDTPAVPDAADNVAREPVVAERPAAAGRSAGAGRSGVPAAAQGADGQRALSEQPATDQSATSEENAPVQAADQTPALPEILATPRKRYIDRQAKAAGIKKGSPGYDQAIQRLQDQYEADVDRASAGITFEQYNELNSDSPEGVNRQAWEALRQEFGQQQYSRNSYRRAPDQGQGARAGQLRMQLKRLTGSWQNAPDVKVVQSIKDLPDRQRRQVERDGAFDVEGIFADGQVYLVADNLRDAQHAAFVLQHEVLGHAGLQGAYGQRLTPLLMSIYNGNPEMKAQADTLVRRFGYKPAVAMEEVLADMAGAGTIQQQAFWPRLVTAMRNALRSIGFNMRWTEGDIQGLLANARRYIERGKGRGRGRTVFSRNGDSGRLVEMVDEQGRLLAPNGKPSKLTQKQWHQARSDNFKRWFGDWQALDAQSRLDDKAPLKLRMPDTWKDLTERERLDKVEASLKTMARQSEALPHDDLGDVTMAMSGAKKAASSAADPAKQAVLTRLQQAFEHSIYASSTLSTQSGQTAAYHKLLAPIDVDGVPLVAVFTVREDVNGRMFYNTVTVDRKENALAVTPGDMSSDAQGSLPANTKASGTFVRRPLARVNPEDVSKVTDGNGEPLVLYHGTAEQFTIFDQSRPGRSTGHTTAPLGVFLTNDGTLAKAYAEKATDGMPGLANVMPLFASIKNPYRMSVAESQSLDSFEKAIAMRQRLEAEGYDGIQLANTGTWVAFYNNQVKSATNNTGAFDQVDPDIRYRRAGQGTVDLLDTFTDRFVTGKTADAFPELNQGARDFLNKIGSPPALTKAKEWVRERTDRVATKIRQGVVDRYAALKELDERLLGKDFIDNAIHSSSWVLARMSSSASGALNAMLSTGRLRFDGKERVITLQDGDKTGGLSAVLTQLGSAAEVERFMGWIAANRADRLMQEGRENLFTADEIASGKQLNGGRTADGKSRQMLYSKVFSEFQQYRDDVLAIAEANGIINADTRAMWRDEFYVPFYRVMDEEAAAGGPRAGKGLSRQEAYKKLKGGKQNLNDLLENTLMNFHHLISASLKNQAATQAMVNAERAGIARVVPESRRDPKTSTFVLKDGDRVFYEIDDPLVFESLTALADPGLNNLAVQTMSAFKRLFTNMTTVTPQFILANTMRDLMQASATSPTSKNLFKNLSQGVAGYRDARTRAEMQASGGAFSFGHLYGADVNEVKASLKSAVKGAELVTDPSMVPKLLRAGWRRWGEVADTAENVSRAATYLQNVDDLGRLRAAYEARDIMDFSQHGAWPAIRFLIRVVPFLNARLQGLDKLYRSGVKPALLTAMGQGTASDKQAAARFSAVTGALTLASIALYLANADDDEYRKLEDWQKDAYWFIRIGDNAFFIPKPFEVGAIATMAERVTEQLVDDKATGKLFADRLKDMMMQTFSFNPVPQMFQPVIDIYSNRDAFTGRDIETAGMERLSKGLRSRDSTTVAAQAVSSASRVFGDETPFALSPVQADHLIRGYFGTVGANAAGIIDTVWRGATGQEAPDKRWSEYQPIRRFYRDLGAPAPYTRYSTLFYDGLREANRIYSDVRELQGLGKTAEAQDLAAEKRGILAMRQQLNRQQRRISEINKQMETVRRSDRDGAWKRKEIDRLTLMRSLITDQVGKQIEAVNAQ
ncbi:LPD38 domain-containing protein [Pseudomonas chengduensis]